MNDLAFEVPAGRTTVELLVITAVFDFVVLSSVQLTDASPTAMVDPVGDGPY